jgi:hypothetical protein
MVPPAGMPSSDHLMGCTPAIHRKSPISADRFPDPSSWNLKKAPFPDPYVLKYFAKLLNLPFRKSGLRLFPTSWIFCKFPEFQKVGNRWLGNWDFNEGFPNSPAGNPNIPKNPGIGIFNWDFPILLPNLDFSYVWSRQ